MGPCELVDVYGYPEEILDFEYDHTYMVRGLVVDKRRGNILKMDRHKYVKVAQHGFKPLDTVGGWLVARRETRFLTHELERRLVSNSYAG